VNSNCQLLVDLAGRRLIGIDNNPGAALIEGPDIEEFVQVSWNTLLQSDPNEILLRAIKFRLGSQPAIREISFLSLYAALESILTHFRRQDEFEILDLKKFGELERALRKWLRQHPSLATEPARRGLIYEKLRELNRFPFSSVFRKFCEDHSVNLSDLWPVIGPHEEWPLLEIRHRLVHGDPFASCPEEALACAQSHLAWTVDRMLLCVLGWPIERSNVSSVALAGCGHYQDWRAQRNRFA
jgi:hypothetical protein